MNVEDLDAWFSKTPASALSRETLSPRELDILRCLSRGMTSAQAGDALGIALETVKHHLKGARYQLRAKNSMHACCEAIRRGLIP